MSLYKPRLSPFFHYDFQVQGRRYHHTTKRTDRREAKAVERAERARITAALAGLVPKPFVVDHAADSTLRERERIAAKFATFQKLDIEPAGYLYRHFEPNGDLLYVGVTLSILGRTGTHLKKAPWKHSIYMIVIEPFETREELLDAERIAILTEFPKYNRVLNGNRNPLQELTKKSKRPPRKPSTRRQLNDQRFQRVLARRTAEAAAEEPVE
jgi:GIY-YIG catalytic domain